MAAAPCRWSALLDKFRTADRADIVSLANEIQRFNSELESPASAASA